MERLQVCENIRTNLERALRSLHRALLASLDRGFGTSLIGLLLAGHTLHPLHRSRFDNSVQGYIVGWTDVVREESHISIKRRKDYHDS